MKEIWKPIKDFEGLYEISNLGNIRSLNFNHTKKVRILKQNTNHNGYKYINLCKNSKQKGLRIHRLVAEAFIPNPNNYSQVNHIDENKSNNKVDNLEWCTCKNNINYEEGIKKRSKSRCRKVIFKENEKIKFIFNSRKEAGEFFKTDPSNITAVIKGRCKTFHGMTVESM